MIIGVIGLGVVGGSMARLLAAEHHTVYGYDINSAISHPVAMAGCIWVSDLNKLVEKADLLIIAVPEGETHKIETVITKSNAIGKTIISLVGSLNSPTSAGASQFYYQMRPVITLRQHGWVNSEKETLTEIAWEISVPSQGKMNSKVLQLISELKPSSLKVKIR